MSSAGLGLSLQPLAYQPDVVPQRVPEGGINLGDAQMADSRLELVQPLQQARAPWLSPWALHLELE